MKLLLIEDDRDAAKSLAASLVAAGHSVDVANSGKDGLFLAMTGQYDVMVVDRMLPEVDGVAILRSLRSAGIATPVLLLRALGRIDQRVEGFEAGCDDYLVKPYAFSELQARLLALARRPPLSREDTQLSCGTIELDRLRRELRCDGKIIDVQPREFQIMEQLMLAKGAVVTRTMLLEKVWDFHFDPKTNIVETHISRLRAKLGAGKAVVLTIKGSGYACRATEA